MEEIAMIDYRAELKAAAQALEDAAETLLYYDIHAESQAARDAAHWANTVLAAGEYLERRSQDARPVTKISTTRAFREFLCKELGDCDA